MSHTGNDNKAERDFEMAQEDAASEQKKAADVRVKKIMDSMLADINWSL